MTGPGQLADISRASAAADGLQRMAGPLFTALRDSAVAMAVTDPRLRDNPIVFVNDAFLALTGYARAELVGHNCRLLQGPGTDRALVAALEAALAEGRTYECELLNFRRDGTPFWNRMFVAPVRDDSGNVAYFLSQQLDVTAAHQARVLEAELRQRQQRLQQVNESLQNVLAISGAAATWEWHIAERRLVGDAGFALLLGVPASDLAAGVAPQAFFANIHPEDRGRIRLAVGGMLRGAEVFSKSYRIVMADGAIRWVHGRGRCAYDNSGQPTRFSGVLVDVTDQKRLEQQLSIAQSAGGVGTFEYVRGFATVSVTPQFCALLGLHAADNLPVRTVNAVVLRGDPPLIDPADDGTPATPGRRVEFRITRPDTGEERWLVRRGEHVEDTTDATGSRFSGVIYDITDAKRIEAQLRALNENLEARVADRTRERDQIWRVSQEFLGVADAAGVWQSVNPAWQKLLGWDEADIVGRSSAWLRHPDDPQDAADVFAGVADGGRTAAFEHRLRHRDGSYRWVSWTAVPAQGFTYCVGRDVTVEKRTAEALKQAEEKLRQAQKMEAVGQLTGGIAHDFNNLLTGITGSLDLMQTRMAQGRTGEVSRYISAAQNAARRAASLTHRLLAFSRQQTLDPRQTDIVHLVAGMQELVERTVGPAIALDVAADGAVWKCCVDSNQLENALLNLCINARDAMPKGGRLRISMSNTMLDGAVAQEFDLSPGGYVVLSVSDTGTGMPQEVIARAFDPFFTTKPMGQGTGLGLSMIFGFARQSGGHVRITSVLREGTTVSIYLPRDARQTDELPHAAQGGGAPRGGGGDLARGETVLVVDDEPTVRMLLTDVLHDLGYKVVEAADGAEGLEVLRFAMHLDLLITDVGLPGGLNGRQMADMGRALRPRLKVLFITGYAEGSVLAPGDLENGMLVLTKPFSIDVVTERIREVIAG